MRATLTGACTAFLLGIGDAQSSEGLSFKNDISLRFDDRSSRPSRWQYRLRNHTAYDFAANWSVHGFLVTGDEFASSHNTLDSSDGQDFYLRRLYVRRENAQGKQELGVIPTYKGRVSSTGLSKDGWISGFRQVSNLEKGQLELVVGELARIDQPSVFNRFDSFDYFELEYSHRFNPSHSAEFSLDRLFGANFVRTEYRYETTGETVLAGEIIHRLDNQESKLVLSLEQMFNLGNYPLESFLVYAYVDEDFGERAELTEDFIGFGHAISAELTSAEAFYQGFKWFAKFEANQDQSRWQLGIKAKL